MFRKKLSWKNFRGQRGYALILALTVLIGMIVLILLPVEFPGMRDTTCRVGLEVDPLAEKPVMLPPIAHVGKFRYGFDGGPDLKQAPVEYVPIRKYVPLFTNTTDPNYVIGFPDWNGKDDQHPNIRWPIIADEEYLGRHADKRHTVFYPEANQKGFDVYYANQTGEVELPFELTDRAGHTGTILTLRTEGFLIFVHLDDKGDPVHINYGQHIYYLVDFYQDKRLYLTPEEEKHYKIDDMFHCMDPDAPSDPSFVRPSQNPSLDQKQLQLEWFLLQGAPGMYAHCKPAVYLYPKTPQLVNVKVYPKGDLTYTDPKYDTSAGWTVYANPNGTMSMLDGKNVPANYLYYESRLLDRYISKPEKGWVVELGERGKDEGGSERYESFEQLFDEVLPKLGLNEKEALDFKEYWLTKLPEAPYYFVGLVEKPQRDFLEQLVVTPEPETSIRFSFYFEALDEPKAVEAPNIVTPERKGFTLVDWGGMIKLHKNTSFTCSQ